MQISERILEELWDFWCWNCKHVWYSSYCFLSLSCKMLKTEVQQRALAYNPISVFLLLS